MQLWIMSSFSRAELQLGSPFMTHKHLSCQLLGITSKTRIAFHKGGLNILFWLCKSRITSQERLYQTDQFSPLVNCSEVHKDTRPYTCVPRSGRKRLVMPISLPQSLSLHSKSCLEPIRCYYPQQTVTSQTHVLQCFGGTFYILPHFHFLLQSESKQGQKCRISGSHQSYSTWPSQHPYCRVSALLRTQARHMLQAAGYDVYANEAQLLPEGEEKHIISVFVADESGMINRVAGVFARRGMFLHRAMVLSYCWLHTQTFFDD